MTYRETPLLPNVPNPSKTMEKTFNRTSERKVFLSSVQKLITAIDNMGSLK
jgi:hypothetical protein